MKRRTALIIIGSAGGVLAVVALVLAGLFVFLQSDGGRKLLAGRLSTLLSSGQDRRVAIDGLSGAIPFNIRIGRIAVSDPVGDWITAEQIHLAWSPTALLKGRIQVDELSASSVTLQRLPSGEQERKEPREPFSIPKALSRLSIGRLSVNELAIGEPVTGQPGVFQIDGNLAGSGEKPELMVFLRFERKDEGPVTRAELTITRGMDSDSLSVRAEFDEAENGWVASTLRIRDAGPMRISLNGDGPLSDWKGALQGSAASLGSIQSEILMQASGGERKLSIQGSFEIPPSFPSPKIAAALQGSHRFDSLIRYKGAKVALEDINVRGNGYNLHLSGGIDSESRKVDARWDINIDDIKMLDALSGSPLAGQLSGSGTLDGTIDAPKGALTVSVAKLRTSWLNSDEAVLDVKFDPLAEADVPEGLRFTGTCDLKNLRTLRGEPLPDDFVHLSFDVKSPRQGNITITSLKAESKDHSLDITGYISPGELSGALESTLHVKDTRSSLALGGKGFGGVLDLKAGLSGNIRSGSASGSFEGSLKEIKAASPELLRLFERGLALRGRFDLQDRSRLRISEVKLNGSFFQLGSKASLDLSKKEIDANWKLSVPKLDPLSPLAGRDIDGSIEADGGITGPFANLKSTSTIKGNDIGLDGRKFGQIVSNIEIKSMKEAPEGTIRLEVRKGKQDFAAESPFRIANRRLALPSITVKAPGALVNGDIFMDMDKRVLAGNLKGSIKDLSAIGELAGERLSGGIEFTARLAQGKEGQDVKLDLKGSKVATPFGKIESVVLTADIADVVQSLKSKAELHVQGFDRPPFTLQALDMKVSGDRKEMSFDSTAKGKTSETFDFRAGGTFSRMKDAQKLQVSTFKGNFGKYPFSLVQPASLESGSEKYSLEKLALSFGKGSMELSAVSSRKAVSISGDFEKIPAGVLASFGGPSLYGTATGNIRLKGEPSRPSGTFQAQLKGIRSPDPALKNMREMVLTADGKLENGRLDTKFDVARQSEKPIEGNLSVPAAFSLSPFSFSMPPQSPLDGRIGARTDLSILTAFYPLDGQKITGAVAGDFKIGGTVSAPMISGTTTIQNGSYENFTHGTVLKGINADIQAHGTRLDLVKLDAGDGEKGRISATGWIELEAARRFPLAIETRASSIALVRRDNLHGIVSGDAKITGSLNDLNLSGKMDVESSEFILARRRTTSMAELNVIEIHGTEGGQAGKAQASPEPSQAQTASRPSTIKLDLGVTLPARAFVRGRGLNSEWKGNLRVAGTSGAPSVTGELSLVRGHYDFLGKRFTLSHGLIQFYGETPPAPTIALTAEAKSKDVTARLILSGLASDPQIQLESEPPLPSEEILSRVLFDRQLTDITPVQAVKLATALRSLSGRGDSLDVLERTRELLHLEQLDIRESNGKDGKEGGYAVGIGKYLTEDIYVDLEKGVGEESGKVSVKVEITPNLTLESEAGMDSSKGIGLNWEHSY